MRFLRRALSFLLIALVLAGAGLWANWQLATPSHDRAWRADHARLPTATETGGAWTLTDIRDWSYGADGGATEQLWIDATLDPAELAQAYFVLEPFGEAAAIAHTMLAFEFADGRTYVASVEARREEGETYSAPKAAILPIFEYMVVWTTDRDMWGNSEFRAGDQLYRYPLAIPLDQQQAVLRAMLERTRALQDSPRFYNTLFSNCTNVLARSVNDIAPGAVSWHPAWHLPGYADDFLWDQGLIGGADTLAAARQAGHLSPHIPAAYSQRDPAAFSRAINAALGAR